MWGERKLSRGRTGDAVGRVGHDTSEDASRRAASLARSRRPRVSSAALFVRCVVKPRMEKAPRETMRRTYRVHSHTRTRAPFSKIKKSTRSAPTAGPPRRESQA